MIVPFPFTFKLTVPGLANPFAVEESHLSSPYLNLPNPTPNPNINPQSDHPRPRLISTNSLRRVSRPRPTSPPAPLTRKRGWEPSFAEPSRSTTTLASTSGYLDTTGYTQRQMSDSGSNVDDNGDEHEDLPPPTKRRRGLAGQIVSTALNAALIGTAVGLTVYRLCVHHSFFKCELRRVLTSPLGCVYCRSCSSTSSTSSLHSSYSDFRSVNASLSSLASSTSLPPYATRVDLDRWRDRGKEREPELVPPPPYEQGEWKPDSTPAPTSAPEPSALDTKEAAPSVKITPSTPRRKARPAQIKRSSASVRRRARHPPSAFHSHAAYAPAQGGQTASVLSLSQSQFDFADDDDEPDEMDWIGDKLAQLIEEGKRALNREVVVMSEAQEDEVDDGSGLWEEEAPVSASLSTSPSKTPSRSSSLRRTKRPRNIVPPLPSSSPYGFGSSSPRKSVFDVNSTSTAPVPITPKNHARGRSIDFPESFKEDQGAWESPEIRESMERARARFGRGGA